MSDTLKQLTHADIHPAHANLRRDVGDITDLAASIAGVGLLQPMLVRKNEDGYELIAGERRWTAIGRLIADGTIDPATTFSTIVRTHVGDAEQTAAMIVENLHRDGLSPVEEFIGMLRLTQQHGWDVKQISSQTGIPLSTVKSRMSWIKLPEDRLDGLVESVGVTKVNELASLDSDTITKILKAKQVTTYHIGDAVSAKERVAEAKRITNKLRRAGHLVVDSIDEMVDESGKDKTPERKLFDKLAAQAKKAGGNVVTQYVNAIDDARTLENIPVPSLFVVSAGQYSVRVERYVVRGVDEQTSGSTSAPRHRKTDYDKAVEAARDEYDKQLAVWDADVKALKHDVVRNGKPAELLPFVIRTFIDEAIDEPAHEFDLVDESDDTTVGEFAAKSAANLARAGAAVAIYYYREDPPGFPERPKVVYPDRVNFTDTGKARTPEQIAEATAAAEREARRADPTQGAPLRDDYDSDDEFAAAQQIYADWLAQQQADEPTDDELDAANEAFDDGAEVVEATS